MKRSVAIIALALMPLLLMLGGCGLSDFDETTTWSAQKLYSEAKNELNNRNWQQAIKYYEKLEARFPFGRFAQQAQIELAYAHFKDNDAPGAVAAADRFIKLHPNHPAVDYAFYLKGIIWFNEDQGFLAKFADVDPSERDPKAARDSFDAFKELAQRFPDSKYTPDGLQRMSWLVNALAAHEVHVAHYYLMRGANIAAVNRAQFAMTTYPQTPAVEDALYVIYKAYEAMDMQDLRGDTERIMRKNFPQSRYLQGGGLTRKKPWWEIW